jgi:ribosomal protein S18 acetylase RimI-like enzyme
MTRIGGVSIRGTWPGTVVLRAGWAKAVARPWHDDDPRASLRFERGSADFLRACADGLHRLGAPEVLSAPVHRSTMGVWTRAGFVPHRQLLLMERSLAAPIAMPARDAEPAVVDDVVAIDRAAFDPEWRIGRLGLTDALEATPRAVVLTIGSPPVGFTIVGVSGFTSYLQRLAVRPESARQGVGADLVRHSVVWAKGTGARSMLLNTQPENTVAMALYRAHGFELLPDRLTVMRADLSAAA